MSAEVEAIARAWIAGMTAANPPSAFAAIADAKIILHEAIGEFVGLDNFGDELIQYAVAIAPHTKVTVLSVLSDEREAVVHWRANGQFPPISPSTLPPVDFALEGTTWLRIEHARVQEVWANWDAAGLLAKLGLRPGDAQR